MLLERNIFYGGVFRDEKYTEYPRHSNKSDANIKVNVKIIIHFMWILEEIPTKQLTFEENTLQQNIPISTACH